MPAVAGNPATTQLSEQKGRDFTQGLRLRNSSEAGHTLLDPSQV